MLIIATLMMITNILSNKYFRNIRINYIVIYVVEIRIRNVETHTTKTMCCCLRPCSPVRRKQILQSNPVFRCRQHCNIVTQYCNINRLHDCSSKLQPTRTNCNFYIQLQLLDVLTICREFVPKCPMPSISLACFVLV
jgi:hypothetical protein